MGEGAKIFYKYIADLSRHYMNARTVAEQARVEWLKDRVAWRKLRVRPSSRITFGSALVLCHQRS